MNQEVSVEIDGETFTAAFIVEDDVVTVFLPDETTRSTVLRGLKPEHAARTHLVSYARTKT